MRSTGPWYARVICKLYGGGRTISVYESRVGLGVVGVVEVSGGVRTVTQATCDTCTFPRIGIWS